MQSRNVRMLAGFHDLELLEKLNDHLLIKVWFQESFQGDWRSLYFQGAEKKNKNIPVAPLTSKPLQAKISLQSSKSMSFTSHGGEAGGNASAAVQYLDSVLIAHRDIKPSNFCLETEVVWFDVSMCNRDRVQSCRIVEG